MAAPKAPSLSEALIDALDELTDYQLQRFKLYLEESDVLGEFEVIPRHKLDTEETTEILKAMKDRYGIFTITVMKTVLKVLNANQVLKELSRCPYDPEKIIAACRKELKLALRAKFQYLIESLIKLKDQMPFDECYTKLFITVADTQQVCMEHEFRQIETHSRTSVQERTIQCQDIFTTKTGQPIRVVLTKGVAGVGKTVLTQKFTLDWAEGKANQDIQLLFHFTFRELNKYRENKYSLVGLLHQFFSQTKVLWSFQHLQLLFIFDGLDECRLRLDFSRTRVLTEPTETASVEVLLVNLIRGSLFPSARIWITTRPAAANQIPSECVSMVTEVRGFTDAQKDEYFRKRIKDEQKATAVISHIKSIRSLYIMCHLPIICRILFTVLLKLMEAGERVELPQTLTQMYIHFLVVQAKVKNIKYEGREETDDPWTPETIEMVQSLGKLAFEKLQEGKLIFYKSDLKECGLDAAEIARYSGVFTEIFREETGQGLGKVYCFIHLSVQEFLAALHVHQTFFSTGENLLSPQCSSESPDPKENLRLPDPEKNQLLPSHPSESLESAMSKNTKELPQENQQQRPDQTFGRAKTPKKLSWIHGLMSCFSPTLTALEAADISESESDEEDLSNPNFSENPTPEEAFYRAAVDKALQSPNGHLDLFLRFLLGLSLPTNQSLLYDLLIQTRGDQTNQDIVNYIKKKLDVKRASAEKNLNLLHCLNELNDRSLMEDMQKYMREGYLSWLYCPSQWSVASFLLLSSDSDLDEFDLRKYCPSVKGLQGLLPVVKVSTKATLSWCGLTSQSCRPGGLLASVLSSSSLTHLDLSNNDLQDSGVELLCAAVGRLKTLCLSGCGLSSLSCAPLASVLSSSSLTHLDLSNNDLLDSGVEQLCEALKNTTCRLNTLKLSGCQLSERGGSSLVAALNSTPSQLSELDLSYNHPGSSAEHLTALLAPHGPLHTLRLDPAGEHWMVPGLRKYSCEVSLDPNTVSKYLRLSKDNRSVSRAKKEQRYPDHEDRFTEWPQVLSSTGLRGRCYWEVDWSARDGGAIIAMSYRGLKSRGWEGGFGQNDESWSLENGRDGYTACHKGKKVDEPGVSLDRVEEQDLLEPCSQRLFTVNVRMSKGRVGVFLDWEAGVLSFYKIQTGGKLSHIHTFITSFTEPLFPGFRLYHEGSSVSLVR